MVSLEVVAILLSGISISASLFYYANVLQNANKTRQTQLLMNLYETYRSPEFRKQQMAIENWEYTDYDDFFNKYGWEDNPESWGIWFSIASFFNGVGVLVERNLIDIGLVEELLGNITDRMWNIMGPVLIDFRKRGVTQKERKYEVLHGFEYLYNQMKSRGIF